MSGAVFFWSKYGSTAQYAHWIGEATGLPVFDVNDSEADPSAYDFLIIGSSVMFYKLTIKNWINANLESLRSKPIILFTVSGAGESTKLDKWVAASLPESLTTQIKHVALLGRMDPAKLGWGLRLIMRIGALLNPDPKASKEEREGFDYVDKSSIQPIVKLVEELHLNEVTI